MADIKEMQSINNVLLATQGTTGDMISRGLDHALLVPPAQRHVLQVELLKMAALVLSTAQASAKLEAEDGCQRKVKDAEAELETRRAAVAGAKTALEAAQVDATAAKTSVDSSEEQLVLQEEEQKQAEAIHEEKSEEVAACEKSKGEVVALMEEMTSQGSGKVLFDYLREAEAEPALLSALPSVLKKAPSEREGFDDVVLAHLFSFVSGKVDYWTDKIEALVAAKASFRAEALGAWAVKEVAGDRVQQVKKELESAEEAVEDARQKLADANEVVQQAERALTQVRAEHSMAGDTLRKCTDAVEAFAKLEAGPKEVAAPMDVDEEPVAFNAAALDMEMGPPITA